MATLSSKLSIYLRGSGSTLLAKGVKIGSDFTSVWLLNRILAKGGYGNYELALTILSLLFLMGSGGLNHAVMYRLSRLDVPPEEMGGHEFTGAALGWSLIVSCMLTAVVLLAGPYIEILAGSDGLAFWISLLAFLIPIRVAKGVYQSWHKARQCIPEAMLIGKMLPSLGKVVSLGVVWLTWRTPQGVVVAVLLSELIPTVFWYMRTPVNPLNLRGELSEWDVWYSMKLALTKGLSKTLKNTDILMVGFLTTSNKTAEYVIAAKIALVLVIIHHMFSNILQPRIGRFLSQKQWGSIIKEYDQARCVSLVFALFGTSFFALFGKEFLQIFGKYSIAYPILIILSTGYVVHTSFGLCGGYLTIAGYAKLSLVTTGFLVGVNVLMGYILIPWYGGTGAAVATLVSYAFIDLIIMTLIYHIDNLKVYSLQLASVALSVILINGMLVGGILSPFAATLGLSIVTIITIYIKIDILSPIVAGFAKIII